MTLYYNQILMTILTALERATGSCARITEYSDHSSNARNIIETEKIISFKNRIAEKTDFQLLN